MIAMLTGKITTQIGQSLVLDVGGVGYRVSVPESILHKTNLSELITLFTHTHVREDLLELYGFESIEELTLFEKLISVSGVGCKSALGVFALGGRKEIFQAVESGDTAFFQRAPRLGKKNAQKIIIELKGKLFFGEGGAGSIPGDETGEIIAALTNFGFTTSEIYSEIGNLPKDMQSTSEKIRLILKRLGKNK